MEGLALLGTRRKHVSVLQHLMGYRRQPVPGWVWEQVYLTAGLKELTLRNHV